MLETVAIIIGIGLHALPSQQLHNLLNDPLSSPKPLPVPSQPHQLVEQGTAPSHNRWVRLGTGANVSVEALQQHPVLQSRPKSDTRQGPPQRTQSTGHPDAQSSRASSLLLLQKLLQSVKQRPQPLQSPAAKNVFRLAATPQPGSTGQPATGGGIQHTESPKRQPKQAMALAGRPGVSLPESHPDAQKGVGAMDVLKAMMEGAREALSSPKDNRAGSKSGAARPLPARGDDEIPTPDEIPPEPEAKPLLIKKDDDVNFVQAMFKSTEMMNNDHQHPSITFEDRDVDAGTQAWPQPAWWNKPPTWIDDIPSWMKEYSKWAARNGLIKGQPSQDAFNPFDPGEP